MRETFNISIDNLNTFKSQLLEWGRRQDLFVLLDSHHYPRKSSVSSHYQYDFLAAWGCVDSVTADENNGFEELEKFAEKKNDWLFGFLTYDLKNGIEKLHSNNSDGLKFPSLHFFQPECVVVGKKDTVKMYVLPNKLTSEYSRKIINEIQDLSFHGLPELSTRVKIKSKFSKNEYLDTVNKLKNHIKHGNIYEISFCQEFYDFVTIDPFYTYIRLSEISPAPFSCFYKYDDKFILSSSPERFIKKTGSRVISQPIKGTAKRGNTVAEDAMLKDKLYNDEKERAENVMIVDLVRNDLSRVALQGSVKVDELYGIYSFEQVHQMISTISCEIDAKDYLEVIKQCFPMGSMTGAPKVRAMQLIEEHERTKRGVFSGSVGYITPEKDFDFNVIIRTILYNSSENYVSYSVGGAITYLSKTLDEYEECMIKSIAMKQVLNG
ncbi:MAG: anthranilate synthase component I family protein [Bacteroidales bacterium]